jgi:hypothetical protein
MATRKQIEDELNEISPGLAGWSVNIPYQVPADYFERLPLQVLALVKNTPGETAALSSLPRANVFEAPHGYFDNFPGLMVSRIRAMESDSPGDELKELSPLLSGIGKNVPFTLPEGYFQDLSQDVVAGVKAIEFVQQELEIVSPLLVQAKGRQVYQAPPGYFEKLPEIILKKVRKNAVKRVISIPSMKNVYRYAAAAVLTGMLAIGAWLFFNNGTSVGPDNEMTSANNQGIVSPAVMEKLSDEEIIRYLDKNEVYIPENYSMAATDMKVDDLKELLTDFSDEELQQYLDNHSVSRDIIN